MIHGLWLGGGREWWQTEGVAVELGEVVVMGKWKGMMVGMGEGVVVEGVVEGMGEGVVVGRKGVQVSGLSDGSRHG